jgi:hypothetical protein
VGTEVGRAVGAPVGRTEGVPVGTTGIRYTVGFLVGAFRGAAPHPFVVALIVFFVVVMFLHNPLVRRGGRACARAPVANEERRTRKEARTAFAAVMGRFISVQDEVVSRAFGLVG